MAAPPIRFGTSGWRGVMGDEFTLPRARVLVLAVARWLRETRAPRRALLAHDARPGGERLVRAAAEVLAGAGVRADASPGVTATPLVTRALAARAAAEGRYGVGLVFTASHNPPAYHGLKVFGADGAVLGPEPSRRIETLARKALAGPAPRTRRAEPGTVDLAGEYVRELTGRLDTGAFRATRPLVVHDAMHGAGAGVLDAVLEDAGARVARLRARRDARFGGAAPDPVAERLAGLSAAVRRGKGLRVGIATDGDADRYAAVDLDGRVLSPTATVALLVDHLARTGRIHRGVAVSVATGSLVRRVAAEYGLPVERHPVGFKWLSASLGERRVDCAGEESGGFVWAGLGGVDKDGILAGALLAELVAVSRAHLGSRLADLERRYGAFRCGRIAVPATEETRQRLAALEKSPPERAGHAAVERVDDRDGLHMGLADGFLMVRASGTEPVVRIYAEAPSEAALRRRLALGLRWLGAGPSGNLAI